MIPTSAARNPRATASASDARITITHRLLGGIGGRRTISTLRVETEFGQQPNSPTFTNDREMAKMIYDKLENVPFSMLKIENDGITINWSRNGDQCTWGDVTTALAEVAEAATHRQYGPREIREETVTV